MSIEEISRASIEAHQANRDRAISERIWVFDETIPATGLSGGSILAPDGESIAYVFTYLNGWRDRVIALIESANRQGPETVTEIRAEITRLEGELSRLSGQPIRIWDGEQGYYADVPPGGALLDIETGNASQAVQWWYPSLEAAKAALLVYARRFNSQGGISENGLLAEIDYPHVAYITRRDTTKGAGK